jgi:hypothetical protein
MDSILRTLEVGKIVQAVGFGRMKIIAYVA